MSAPLISAQVFEETIGQGSSGHGGRKNDELEEVFLSPSLTPTPSMQELLGATWENAYLSYTAALTKLGNYNMVTLTLEQLVCTLESSQLPPKVLIVAEHHIWPERVNKAKTIFYNTLSEGLVINPEDQTIIGVEDIIRYVPNRHWPNVTFRRRLDIGLCLAIKQLAKMISQ